MVVAHHNQVSYRVDLPIDRQQVAGRVQSQFGGTSGKRGENCRRAFPPLGPAGKRVQP
jgi:hypothetical protein